MKNMKTIAGCRVQSLGLLGLALFVLPIMPGAMDRPVTDRPVLAEERTITMGEINAYLQDKREHYPFSDEYIEHYQQASGGYIAFARQKGLTVDRQLHEPNQKWHYFISWFKESNNWKETSSAKRAIKGLKCPELLLWIYEACGIEPAKVKDAKLIAEKGKAAGKNANQIAPLMWEKVTWDDLAALIP